MPNTARHLASISTAAIFLFSYCLSLRFRRIDVLSTPSIGERVFFSKKNTMRLRVQILRQGVLILLSFASQMGAMQVWFGHTDIVVVIIFLLAERSVSPACVTCALSHAGREDRLCEA